MSTWVTDLNIAAGAKDTDVHKAHVRITIVPAKAGVQVLPAINGGGGDSTPSTLTPATALTTDGSGVVTTDYTSSDKVEDATIKVTSLAGCTVAVDLGSTLHHKWDCSGAHDFEFPVYFIPEEPDNVRFYPTLDVEGGVGAIDTHAISYYTYEVTLWKSEYNFAADAFSGGAIVAQYPTYAALPTGYVVEDFVTHSTVTETSGVYENTQTVHDQWDYDFETEILTEIFVDGYQFGAYDLDVCGTP